MRILFVTQYFAPEIGAAPVRLTALADALETLGHEVTVLTSLPNYPTGRTFPGYRRRLAKTDKRLSGVKVVRVWTFPARGAGIARYLNYLSFLLTAPLRLWSFKRPDVMLIELPPLTTAVLGWLIGRIRRAPMILNVADLWPDAVVGLGLVDESSLQVALARRLEHWSYGKAILLSYATVGIGEDLVAKGVDRDRTVFLPNGADTVLFAPRDPKAGLLSEIGVAKQHMILYAGTHSMAAGMEVLLDTAEMFSVEDSIVIVLVGDGPAKAPLVAEMKRRGLTNLVFRDPVPPERVAEMYNVAAAGLVTLADNETFAGTARPAKMFPPLASGKPVVYSGSGEGADLVTEHAMGIVVAPEDPEALADAIRRVVADPDAAAAMGENGRRFVEEHLSWDAIAGTWLHDVQDRLGRGPLP